MNNILVWKGYGEIDVYSANTVDEVSKIISRVSDIFKYWNDNETVEELNTLIDKVRKYSVENNDSELGLAKRLRNNLHRFLDNRNLTNAYDVEEFEYFYFQEVKQID